MPYIMDTGIPPRAMATGKYNAQSYARKQSASYVHDMILIYCRRKLEIWVEKCSPQHDAGLIVSYMNIYIEREILFDKRVTAMSNNTSC